MREVPLGWRLLVLGGRALSRERSTPVVAYGGSWGECSFLRARYPFGGIWWF